MNNHRKNQTCEVSFFELRKTIQSNVPAMRLKVGALPATNFSCNTVGLSLETYKAEYSCKSLPTARQVSA